MPADAEPPQAPEGEFPSPQFPTVFADGVMSLVNSPTTVKFFLSRFEPSFVGDGKSQMQAFAQVIMPIDGFAAMFVFFEAHLRAMVKNGIMTDSKLSDLRSLYPQEK